jgi:hypothetical protein
MLSLNRPASNAEAKIAKRPIPGGSAENFPGEN